nr:hypothetical protein [Kineosporia rhizophila]
MSQPDTSDHLAVVRREEQGHGLGETFERHLVRRVDRQEPDPGHVGRGADLRVRGELHRVAQELVHRELADLDLGEGGVAAVESQPHVRAGAVEPVGPVVVDVCDLDGDVIGRGGLDQLA